MILREVNRVGEGKKNVPKLRFKGYEDAWEQRKLGNVAKYRNGKAHEQSVSENGKYVIVNSKFVSTNGEVQKFSCEQIEPLFKNEIAFVLSDVPNGRAIARTFLIPHDDKYTLNQRIAGITPNETTDCYFLHLLMNRNHYFLRFDDGVKQTNLSVNDVMGFSTYYPLYKEQQLCGQFFKKIDNLITLHQRKYDALKTMKKTLLSKMFPKDGEDVPEIRFKGFTDAWEQRKLGEFSDMFNGDRSSKYPNASDMLPEGIPFINAGDLQEGRVNLETCNKISKGKYDELSGAKLSEGDIVYCLRGSLGKNAYIDNFSEGTIASSLVAIRPKMINGRFLFHILNSDIEYKQRVLRDEGAAQPNLSAKSLSEFVIPIPKAEEDQSVADFLDNVDNYITLHQRKLEELKNMKKTLLQQMFV